MSLLTTLKPKRVVLGDTIELPRVSLALSASTPTVEITESETEVPNLHRVFLNKIAWAPILVTTGSTSLKLKSRKPKIKVSQNHRSCAKRTSLSYSTKRPEVAVQFSETRRLEEIELTELLAGIL